MNDPSLSEPIAKRADQLVVGDRIPDEFLAFRFNQGPAAVVFLAYEAARELDPLPWVFVAYQYPNGRHDSMTIRPEAVLMVYPADPPGHDYTRADDDPEVTQPIAGRIPARHEDGRTGEVVMVGGHAAVPFAGGLIEEGFVPAFNRVDQAIECLDPWHESWGGAPSCPTCGLAS